MVSVQISMKGSLGTYFDSTPVALYNGVNPMRKDSGITEKQGLR